MDFYRYFLIWPTAPSGTVDPADPVGVETGMMKEFNTRGGWGDILTLAGVHYTS